MSVLVDRIKPAIKTRIHFVLVSLKIICINCEYPSIYKDGFFNLWHTPFLSPFLEEENQPYHLKFKFNTHFPSSREQPGSLSTTLVEPLSLGDYKRKLAREIVIGSLG